MNPADSARVIPVLDLMGGAVVRAQRGERGSYRPIQTPLADGSDPVVIAQALLDRCPVPDGEPLRLYVADLDALTGGAIQIDVLRRLLDALPGLSLWLDAGFRDPTHAAEVRRTLEGSSLESNSLEGQPSAVTCRGGVQPVIASESIADARCLEALGNDEHAILSLDCRRSHPMDPAGVWQRPELWPATLIVMTLDRVGADAGPDFDTLRHLRERAGSGKPRRWIGAGGLRDARDLGAAARNGAHAWLVASALHDGRLDPRVPTRDTNRSRAGE